MKTGTVIGQRYPRQRAAEFRRFLDESEAAVSAVLDVHLVLDDPATHKTKLIRDWLAQRPRYHAHFKPTSASWINQVERWFGLLTELAIRHGGPCSVEELERDIRAFIAATNVDPKPVRRVKSADAILASVKRFWLRTLDAQTEDPGLPRTSDAGY